MLAALSVEVEVKCILLLPSAHILLLLWSRPECVLVWLLLLLLRSPKGIERVLAHRSRHTWLVGVHTHGHASTHATCRGVHASHTRHRSWHATCGGVHASHTWHRSWHASHSWHRTWHRSRHGWTTEGVRLETGLGWRLLHCTEGIGLGLLSRVGSTHELGEWVCSGQLLLRLELIGLRWLPSRLVIIVEALKHAQLVGVGQRGKWLVTLCKDVIQGVRGRFAGVAATLGSICREDIEKIVGHVCISVCSGSSISRLRSILCGGIRCEVKEVVGGLILVGRCGSWLIGSLSVIHKLTKSESRLLSLLSCRLDLFRSGSCCLSWLCRYSCEIARINHLKKTEILIHLELLGGIVIDYLGRGWHSVILVESVQCIAVKIHALDVL